MRTCGSGEGGAGNSQRTAYIGPGEASMSKKQVAQPASMRFPQPRFARPAQRRRSQRTASRPALAALPMATVATGTPLGICDGRSGQEGRHCLLAWTGVIGGAWCAGPQHMITSSSRTTALSHPALAPNPSARLHDAEQRVQAVQVRTGGLHRHTHHLQGTAGHTQHSGR